MSALTRMASNDHKSVQIRKDDIIVLSSSPIPGNEKTISNVVNKLLQKGAHGHLFGYRGHSRFRTLVRKN